MGCKLMFSYSRDLRELKFTVFQATWCFSKTSNWDRELYLLKATHNHLVVH